MKPLWWLVGWLAGPLLVCLYIVPKFFPCLVFVFLWEGVPASPLSFSLDYHSHLLLLASLPSHVSVVFPPPCLPECPSPFT